MVPVTGGNTGCMVPVTGGNVLIVAHKGSIDVCSRKLRQKAVRSRREFRPLVDQVPSCAMGCLRESKGSWELVNSLVPPHTHSANGTFNWKIWL